MAFLLTAEQVAQLKKMKPKAKAKTETKELFKLGVNKNGKVYLVMGGNMFYIHQVKSIVKAMEDSRFKVDLLKEQATLMDNYRTQAADQLGGA